MWTFARSEALTLELERRPADEACPECGAEALAAYPVMSDGGRWQVANCQKCLASVERVDGPRLGSHTPLGAGTCSVAREPQRVPIDVRDAYVSIEAAALNDGVVVIGDPKTDPEQLRIDHPATEVPRRPHADGPR